VQLLAAHTTTASGAASAKRPKKSSSPSESLLLLNISNILSKRKQLKEKQFCSSNVQRFVRRKIIQLNSKMKNLEV
jgi:hypothetical protein